MSSEAVADQRAVRSEPVSHFDFLKLITDHQGGGLSSSFSLLHPPPQHCSKHLLDLHNNWVPAGRLQPIGGFIPVHQDNDVVARRPVWCGGNLQPRVNAAEESSFWCRCVLFAVGNQARTHAHT